jgi:hypothetical protein
MRRGAVLKTDLTKGKIAGKDWLISFCKKQKFSTRLHEKYSLLRTLGFNVAQVPRYLDNLSNL